MSLTPQAANERQDYIESEGDTSTWEAASASAPLPCDREGWCRVQLRKSGDDFITVPFPESALPALATGATVTLYGDLYTEGPIGADIGGTPWWFETEAERLARAIAERHLQVVTRDQRWEEVLEPVKEAYAQLTSVFQERVIVLSQTSEDWWQRFGTYEVTALTAAQQVALWCRGHVEFDSTLNAMRAFLDLPAEDQEQRVPELAKCERGTPQRAYALEAARHLVVLNEAPSNVEAARWVQEGRGALVAPKEEQ